MDWKLVEGGEGWCVGTEEVGVALDVRVCMAEEQYDHWSEDNASL